MTESHRNEELDWFSPEDEEFLRANSVPDPAFGPKGPKLVVTPELERIHLHAAGLYGEDDPFFRELLGDDVCDYRND